MARGRDTKWMRRATGWTGVFLTLGLVGSVGVRIAYSQGTTPADLSDDWKGDKLDPKWHVTVMGDAQPEDNAVQVNNGSLKITAGGSDIWTDNDNGIFLWQPANGDFEATIEVRSITKISDALNSNKVGIMVRPNLDNHSSHIYMIAMPKGTHLQARTDVGEQAGPASGDAGRLPWGDGTGSGPNMLLRLTRVGNAFTSARSFDGGKTWERLHDADHPDTDTIEQPMPDDVIMGIMVGAIHGLDDTTLVDAVVGPFQFKQLATRPTTNGLLAATAVDANGKPLEGGSLVVKKGNDVVGTTTNDITDPATSNTGSFFLAPGSYTIQAGETDLFSAGAPVPFEVVTGKTEEIKIKAGAAK